MKPLCRFCVCFILGVVTTLGVAWAIAFDEYNLTRGKDGRNLRRTTDGRLIMAVWVEQYGESFGQVVVAYGHRFTRKVRDPNRDGDPLWWLPTESALASPEFVVDTQSYGLPYRSFAHQDIWFGPGPTNVPDQVRGRITLSNGRELPYWPLWRGLLADSLLACLLYLGLWQGMIALRVWRRRRRSRCPRCGYHLIDADRGCSECGWGVKD